MSRKFLKKYDYDISLDDGAGAHLIAWVTGLMVFFVALTLAANFGLSIVVKSWTAGLSDTVTIEIKSSTKENRTAQILSQLKKTNAVREARLLPESEIRDLVGQWTGRSTSLDGISLPTLIDVKLTPGSSAARLAEALKTIEPSAVIDAHTDMQDDVNTLAGTAFLFMTLLSGVITVLAVIVISGIVKSKLLIHQAEVKTLHLIGASDEYIARQFRQHTLRGALTGALIGIACAFAVLLMIGAVTRTLNTDILPHLRLMPLQWALLIFSPIVVSSVIAHMTAQATVLKELSRLP